MANEFGRASKIRNACVYGGAPKRPQLMDLERGKVDVLTCNFFKGLFPQNVGFRNIPFCCPLSVYFKIMPKL